MKKLIPLFLAALMSMSLTACGGDAEADSGAKDSGGPAAVVTIKNMAYSLAEVTIHKGETVQWRWADNGMPHDVVSDGENAGELKSDLLTQGTWTHTFEQTGTFTYHCTPHPDMTAKVVVTD